MRRFLAGFVIGVAATLGGLSGLGHLLDVEDPLARADAIVALSGDTGARTATAVQLWRAGYAPVIVFAGGSEEADAVASAEIMRRTAVVAGVPEAATIVEPASATTEENAERVAELMKARGLRSAILVTSPYHQRRASILFARAFEPSLTFRNYPARDADWDANTWWTREPSRTRTVVEIAKLSAEVASLAFH